MRTKIPILFYTVGLPGAGKTTFASSLSYWLAAEHLRGDKIGLELFRFPTFSSQERQMVYGEMNRRAGESLHAGQDAIYDAAVNTRLQRNQLTALAKQNGGEAIGMWVQVPAELAKKRAGSLRDTGTAGLVARVIPPHIFDQYTTAFEIPTKDENIVRIPGDACFALQYARLRRQLRNHKTTALPRLI